MSNREGKTADVSQSVELELKFTATAEDSVPDFTALSQVASTEVEVRELSARYFDTADLRLTRAKHTLRRRTGGSDEGWHLKAPAVDAKGKVAGRLEYGAALSDSVPEELLAPVRSLVRDAQLLEIAQVDNRREVTLLLDDRGEVLVEFCDDHVTARSLIRDGDDYADDSPRQWREWEAELVAGDEALLEDIGTLLVQQGAKESDTPSKLAAALGDTMSVAPVPPQPAKLPEGTPGHTVIAALADNVAKLIAIDPAVRRDEWDSIHQMRVATREIRSHLQTFHGISVGEHLPQLEKDLKALASTLGAARDAEVVAERAKHTVAQLAADKSATSAALPVDLSELADDLDATLRKDYQRFHRRCVQALNSDRYFRLLDQLEALLAAPPLAENIAGGTPAAKPAGSKKKKKKKARKTKVSGANSGSAVVLAEHLDQAMGRFNKRIEAVSANTESTVPDELYHDVRKAAKKVRYSAEAAGKAGLPTKQLYEAMKQLQSSLGDFQDTCTASHVYATKARRARISQSLSFGYGMAYQLERDAGTRYLEQYAADVQAAVSAYKKFQRKLRKSSPKKRH